MSQPPLRAKPQETALGWNGNYRFGKEGELLAFVRQTEGGWVGAVRSHREDPWRHTAKGVLHPSAHAAKLAVERIPEPTAKP